MNEIRNSIQKNNNQYYKTIYSSWEHNNVTYAGRKLFDQTLLGLSKEKNISINLESLDDKQRIDYYNQYQDVFDAVSLWPGNTRTTLEIQN